MAKQDDVRDWILARFSLKTARNKGGLSPVLIRGGSRGAKFEDHELDAALKSLRDDGTLAFTGGLWWKR